MRSPGPARGRSGLPREVGGDRGDHPHRRGLAGAVGPEEPEGLPRPHVEVDARGPPRTSPYDLRSRRARIRRGHGPRTVGLAAGVAGHRVVPGAPASGVEDMRPTLRPTTDRRHPCYRLDSDRDGGEDHAMTQLSASSRPVVLVTGVGRTVGIGAGIALTAAPRTAGTSRRRTGRAYDDRMPWGRQTTDPAPGRPRRWASRAPHAWPSRPTSPTWRLPGRVFDAVEAGLGPVTALVMCHCESVDSGLLDTTVESFDRHYAVATCAPDSSPSRHGSARSPAAGRRRSRSSRIRCSRTDPAPHGPAAASNSAYRRRGSRGSLTSRTTRSRRSGAIANSCGERKRLDDIPGAVERTIAGPVRRPERDRRGVLHRAT